MLLNKVRNLIEATLLFTPLAGTACVSSIDSPWTVVQGKKDGERVLHVSLGCDGIVVIAYECGEIPARPPPPKAPERTYDESSWYQFVQRLSSDDEDTQSSELKPKLRANVKPPSPPHAENQGLVAPPPSTNGTRYTAIRVRSGDALILTGPCAGEACW